MGISSHSAFVGVLVAVLCCHGYERDLNTREKKKKNKAAAKAAAKEDIERQATAAEDARKLAKAKKRQAKRESRAQEQEAIAMDEYRRRPLTPADFESRRRYSSAF